MQGVLSPENRHQGSTLWLTGGLLALALHGGLAAWWLWAPDPVAADDAPPAAIMIEVADTAEAVTTEQNNITTERVNARASQAQSREASQSEGAAAPAEPQPVKAPQKPLPVVERAAVTQAATRAAKSRRDEQRRAQQARQQREKQQEQQREQQASAQAVQAQVQAQQAQRNAARQTVASSTISPQQRATWASKVMAHIEKRKRQLEVTRAHDVAVVTIGLDGKGYVLNAMLKQSSGTAELDREALALIRRSSPLPAPPDGREITLSLSIAFAPSSGRR